MSFDGRELRRGKDVFDADGVYLGTVVWVVTDTRAQPDRTASGQTPRDDVDREPVFSGESIGPMPTAALGNTGPDSQARATTYATTAGLKTNEPPPTALLLLRLLTSMTWSTLRPRLRRIPVSLVQTASHERIVLSVTEKQL